MAHALPAAEEEEEKANTFVIIRPNKGESNFGHSHNHPAQQSN